MRARHVPLSSMRARFVPLSSMRRVFSLRCSQHDGERTFTACGTVEYMAPELIKLKGHSFEVILSPNLTLPSSHSFSISCIHAQVDWWSIGVLLYECLHGYTPFSEEGSIEDDWQVIRNIVNASYPLRYGHLLSDEAIQLMKEMLTHDPAERIDAQGMQKHPFFSCATPI